MFRARARVMLRVRVRVRYNIMTRIVESFVLRLSYLLSCDCLVLSCLATVVPFVL